mgnify:CR=1 FL=1
MTEVNERKRAAAAALFLFPIPGARASCWRLAFRKPNKFGFRARTLEREEVEKQPMFWVGSRPPAGKANKFGFRARTLERNV